MAKRKNRKKYRKQINRTGNPDIQKWLLNIVIFCLAVVIIGFMFSTGNRLLKNTDKIELSHVDTSAREGQQFSYITVEVLNGCGVTGLAQKFTNYLRQQGFDVVYTGNADRMDYASTHIIQRAVQTEKEKSLLKALELAEERLIEDSQSTPHVDYTIILGKDYNQLNVYSQVLDIKEKIY